MAAGSGGPFSTTRGSEASVSFSSGDRPLGMSGDHSIHAEWTVGFQIKASGPPGVAGLLHWTGLSLGLPLLSYLGTCPLTMDSGLLLLTSSLCSLSWLKCIQSTMLSVYTGFSAWPRCHSQLLQTTPRLARLSGSLSPVSCHSLLFLTRWLGAEQGCTVPQDPVHLSTKTYAAFSTAPLRMTRLSQISSKHSSLSPSNPPFFHPLALVFLAFLCKQ